MRATASVLSLLAPGLGQLYNRQWLKGLLFLIVDIVGIWYFVRKLPHAVWGVVTLGEQGSRLVKVGKLTQNVAGDHSIQLLILGLIILTAFLLFVWFYYSAVRDAYKVAGIREKGGAAPTFGQTLYSLIDGKFPQTILLIPFFGILFLTIMPIVFMILLAFTNFSAPDHIPAAKLVDWVGFQTFVDLLKLKTWSHTFLGVLRWTVIWAILATVTTYFGGLLVALLIQQPGIRFKKFWRLIFILPFAIPQLVSTLVMRNLFNGSFGPINQYLGYFGIDKVPWLSDPNWAKATVILVNMWIGIPVTMILMLGVLTTIPRDLYEAAEVDGASSWAKFKTITIPRILFATAPVLITQFAGNINNFNVIYLLTNGNPTNGDYQFAGHTDLLVTWLYKLTLDQNKFNMASAVGIILFLIIASISILTYRRTKSFREEDMVQ